MGRSERGGGEGVGRMDAGEERGRVSEGNGLDGSILTTGLHLCITITET